MLTDSTDKTASGHNSAHKRSVFSGHRCPRAHRGLPIGSRGLNPWTSNLCNDCDRQVNSRKVREFTEVIQ